MMLLECSQNTLVGVEWNMYRINAVGLKNLNHYGIAKSYQVVEFLHGIDFFIRFLKGILLHYLLQKLCFSIFYHYNKPL